MNIQMILGNLAVFAVPVAPATFFGIAIYDSLFGRLGAYALPVAVVGAAGFEMVGILNGHAMVSLWQAKRYALAGVAGLLLSLYVVIGLYELGLNIGGLLILVGAIMYVTQGIIGEISSHVAGKKAREVSSVEQAKQARQDAKDERERTARLEHELKLANLEAHKAVKLAGINAQLSPPVQETFQKVSVSFPSDWRTLTDENKAQLRQMAEAEIAEAAGVTPKTARAWMARLGTAGEA